MEPAALRMDAGGGGLDDMPPTNAPPHHILVLANRTCPCPGLHDFVHAQLTERPAEVTVVAPALNDSRLAHWVSDSDKARAAAGERLEQAVEGLTTDGVTVSGHIGDAKPLTAIEDALSQIPADLLVLSTFPPGESHWLEEGLLEAAERLSIPVRHYVSEYGLERRSAT